MEKIRVDFETITPIWTGDAWGENSELKASSIMGSLRFWFEVYCHFAGIEVKEKEELNYQEFITENKKNIDNISDNKILKNMNLSLSSKIFGCTGWRSRIEIDEISFNQSEKYPYPIKKVQLQNLEYYSNWKRKNITPSWFFQKGFYGNGYIVFKTTTDIKDNILLPLLNFIEKYAFIGAKNNIGYGRVKFNEIQQINTFKFTQFGLKKDSNIDDLIKSKKLITNNSHTKNNLSDLIKQLLEQKAKLRKQTKKQEVRHYNFGTIKKAKWEKIDIPQATKIIPLISKNNNNSYSGRFLSIVGIKDFGDKQ